MALQFKAEFKRIITTDILKSFLDGLDGLVPRLLKVYKAATRSGKKRELKKEKDVSGGADGAHISSVGRGCCTEALSLLQWPWV